MYNLRKDHWAKFRLSSGLDLLQTLPHALQGRTWRIHILDRMISFHGRQCVLPTGNEPYGAAFLAWERQSGGVLGPAYPVSSMVRPRSGSDDDRWREPSDEGVVFHHRQSMQIETHSGVADCRCILPEQVIATEGVGGET
jgi:hypothetical protein